MDPGEDPDKDSTIEENRIRSELIKSFLNVFHSPHITGWSVSDNFQNLEQGISKSGS